MNQSRPEEDPRIAELDRLLEGHPGVQLNLGWVEAVAIIAYLDLALSHPCVAQSPSREVMVAMRDGIIQLLAGDNLRIADMLRTGKPPAEWN